MIGAPSRAVVPKRTQSHILTLSPMRRIALALSLGLVLGLGACNSDNTSPNGSVVGTYQLQRINGNTLPYTFPGGTTMTSDQLTLNSDGSYTDVVNYSNSATTIERGFYTANNGDLTFDDRTDNIIYKGSVSGTVLTTIVGSYTSVYQKN
jgi:hypothetical protein